MYKIIVMVKQVPDTGNITGDVMKEDGTVNRGKLPAILNNEDREALELALQIKDKYSAEVSVITMGPPRAVDILKEALFMGADRAYLISDRKFAGSDTLATSYVISQAIKHIGTFDIVFAGRQAIDGDTAQVGPQTAEKLGLPQVTYTKEILEVKKEKIKIKRAIEGGYEILGAKMPLLLTVIKGAVEPRPFSAKRVMAYKNAKSLLDIEKMRNDNTLLTYEDLLGEYKANNLYLNTLTMEDLKLDETRLGIKGSPTKVYKIESVVLSGGKAVDIKPDKKGINNLIESLLEDHILG